MRHELLTAPRGAAIGSLRASPPVRLDEGFVMRVGFVRVYRALAVSVSASVEWYSIDGGSAAALASGRFAAFWAQSPRDFNPIAAFGSALVSHR